MFEVKETEISFLWPGNDVFWLAVFAWTNAYVNPMFILINYSNSPQIQVGPRSEHYQRQSPVFQCMKSGPGGEIRIKLMHLAI